MRDSVMLPASLQGYHEVIFDNLADSDWVLSSYATLLSQKTSLEFTKFCYCSISPAQEPFSDETILINTYTTYIYILIYLHLMLHYIHLYHLYKTILYTYTVYTWYVYIWLCVHMYMNDTIPISMIYRNIYQWSMYIYHDNDI